MPFGSSGWPTIIQSTDTCRRLKEHRLYRAIGRKCPCGPIPLKVSENHIEYELHVFADNIQVVKGHETIIDLNDMLQRIKELEAKLEELSKKEQTCT